MVPAEAEAMRRFGGLLVALGLSVQAAPSALTPPEPLELRDIAPDRHFISSGGRSLSLPFGKKLRSPATFELCHL